MSRISFSLKSPLLLCAKSLMVRHFSKERAGKSIKPGASIVLEGIPYRVTKTIQGKRGKGGGFVRATLRNLLNPNSFEKTFTSDELVEHADLEKVSFQYSWNDGQTYRFLDSNTFEEVSLNSEDVDCKDFLLEGQTVRLQLFNGKSIGVEIPLIGEYKVTKIDEAKTTASAKVAIIETGASIIVPLFVEEGDVIRVNTEDKEYLDRIVN